MPTSITRRFQFCAGHRVYQHESKCKHPHGHNYVLLAEVRHVDDKLDSLGRVIDFSVVKEIIGTWIDENWDHGFIYFDQDLEITRLLSPCFKSYPLNVNPTAENMARHLIHEIFPTIFGDSGLQVTKVVLWETENCYAEVTV